MTARGANSVSRRAFLKSASAAPALALAPPPRSAQRSTPLRAAENNPRFAYGAIKAEFEEYGYIVLRGAIPRKDAARVERRVREIMARQPNAKKIDQHLPGFFNHLDPKDDALFLPLVTQPICLRLARDFLGERFQMTEVGCRWRKPGAPEGPIHVGVPLDALARAGLPNPNVCFVVGISWILHDLTRDMGTSFNLPFSHHAPRGPRRGVRYKDLVPVEAPAGSLLIYHGALWHKFGPNTTKDKSRVGLMGGYCPFWMDLVAAGWQLMKRSVRDRLPKEVQRMNRHVRDG
jgi:ectoine hydroxylase-related dioxygenase (phytanoyl-CoA dioxygenase family)